MGTPGIDQVTVLVKLVLNADLSFLAHIWLHLV
jgi:hypothetical protein